MTREFNDREGPEMALYAEGRGRIPPGVQIYAIDGPFFFGAAEKFKETLGQVAGKPGVAAAGTILTSVLAAHVGQSTGMGTVLSAT